MSTATKWAGRLPALAVVLASLTLCTSAAAQAAGPSTGKSFLWKVQSGAKVLYLAGSVHALAADAYPLSAAYENAFAAAGTLVEEINLAEAGTTSLSLDTGYTIDLTRLSDVDDPDAAILSRYARTIQLQRQDFNGRVLTIRGDDQRSIAAMLDIPVDQVTARLEALDLVFRPS